MSVEKIIASWKKKAFKPVYWLDGEEPYYIDTLIRYAEHEILSESEASFNLTVFYGKDADWTAVINACRRYPMFAEKQVVILKEAQQMNSLEKLEAYLEDPLASTIFIVGYKGKGVDKRTKFYKTLSKQAECVNFAKIKDDKIYDWILNQIQSKGLTATPKAVSLIEEHVGNDLSRIETEIEKLLVNLTNKKEVDEDDIEKYIGISKEYNIFELQAAIAKKDLAKAVQIIAYFESNPKAVPIQMALPALYSFFSKVYLAYGMKDQSDNALLPVFYRNFYSLKQAKETMRNYGYPGVERILLLMNHFNLKSVGVGDVGTSSASLMREMVVKMMI